MVKTQYIDTVRLQDYIKNSDVKIGAICKALGISRQAFDKKRRGKISFRASEVYVICDMLKIPYEERPKIFCLKG